MSAISLAPQAANTILIGLVIFVGTFLLGVALRVSKSTIAKTIGIAIHTLYGLFGMWVITSTRYGVPTYEQFLMILQQSPIPLLLLLLMGPGLLLSSAMGVYKLTRLTVTARAETSE